jgi:hypothetical protein
MTPLIVGRALTTDEATFRRVSDFGHRFSGSSRSKIESVPAATSTPLRDVVRLVVADRTVFARVAVRMDVLHLVRHPGDHVHSR